MHNWASVMFRVTLVVVFMALSPTVKSQLDFFDEMNFLDSASGPVMHYCLNEKNLNIGVDLIAVEIPSQFMLNGLEQEFPIRKLNALNCEHGKSTVVLNTMDYNRTESVPESHFTPEGGLFLWNGQYYDPGLYCIERLEGSEFELSVCSVACSGPILCYPKCCPFNHIFDPERQDCLPSPQMPSQLPSVYQTLEMKLPKEFVNDVIPIHYILKTVDCELSGAPQIYNESEFRLLRNGHLYTKTPSLLAPWRLASSEYNYCFYERPDETNGQMLTQELFVYRCALERSFEVEIEPSVRANAKIPMKEGYGMASMTSGISSGIGSPKFNLLCLLPVILYRIFYFTII